MNWKGHMGLSSKNGLICEKLYIIGGFEKNESSRINRKPKKWQ